MVPPVSYPSQLAPDIGQTKIQRTLFALLFDSSKLRACNGIGWHRGEPFNTHTNAAALELIHSWKALVFWEVISWSTTFWLPVPINIKLHMPFARKALGGYCSLFDNLATTFRTLETNYRKLVIVVDGLSNHQVLARYTEGAQRQHNGRQLDDS